MSKHTPGPWRITGSKTKYIEAPLRDGWEQEVCAVGPTEADNGYGIQHEANARLIAAAPELLEALKKMLDEHYYQIGYDMTIDNPACVAAVAAITKATGVPCP